MALGLFLFVCFFVVILCILILVDAAADRTRLEWLIKNKAYPMYDYNVQLWLVAYYDQGRRIKGGYDTPRAAIDAAMRD